MPVFGELTRAEVIGALFEFFGTRRATELLGWAAIWDFVGEEGAQGAADIYRKFHSNGISRASAFRAAHDAKVFKEHLEARGYQYATVARVFDALR